MVTWTRETKAHGYGNVDERNECMCTDVSAVPLFLSFVPVSLCCSGAQS